MRKKTFTMRPTAKPKWKESGKSVEEIVTKLQKSVPQSPYREQSLRIHGLICAKCAREFDYTDRHLLTVHHRDGNHNNNPCVYCHDDEHQRGILGDYFSEGERK